MLLIDETMNMTEFKEYQRVQELPKEERKLLKEKLMQQKQKQKAKERKERLKEKKRQKKMRDSGALDIANDLKTNKNIGK